MDSAPLRPHNGGLPGHRRLVRPAVVLLSVGLAALGFLWRSSRRASTDSDWVANAVLRDESLVTDGGVGKAQGVGRRGDRLYVYGEVRSDGSAIGVIRERTLDLKATGAEVRLTRDGRPLLRHPTGLTWDDEFGCFVGDTVDRVGMIYRIDWERALAEGHLDRSVLAEIRDDAATEGSRPEFVTHAGRRFLATADYGDKNPEIRLYDPARLVHAKRSAAPEVVVYRFPCGPFNQTLSWDESAGELTCVQNVVTGRGWRLDVVDLATAIEQRSIEGARRRTLVFEPHDELEGYCPLPGGMSLFVISRGRNNLVRGTIQQVEPFVSPAR